MIYLEINTHEFDNDVRVMIGAFYPGEKIVLEKNEECFMDVRVWDLEKEIKTDVTFDGKDVSFSFEKTADVKSDRNRLKRELYHVFSDFTHKELPWGTLTGIRPVKIPVAMLEQNASDEDIFAELKKEYLISDKKAELSVAVAHREKRLLETIDYKNGYSLYIGIPFCPTTCLYCSFTSYPISMWKNRVDEYIDALIKEIDYIASLKKGKCPDSIYIGGGTPTTLLPNQSDRLLTHIENVFDLNGLREYTVEAGRPDSIDRDKLLVLKAHGIDRISINPQTMNQKTLDVIGRRHTVEEVKFAFNLARECGFTNINMDLIVGLPGEDRVDVEHTLEEVRKLDPDSLTVHSLALKRAARLNIQKEKYASYDVINTDEIIDMTYDFAKSLGMSPYYLYRQKNMAGNFENVGYAKPGKAGIYNILIMEEKQSIFAAGANAQTKVVSLAQNRVDRIENVKDVSNYIERVDEMIDRKRCFFNE